MSGRSLKVRCATWDQVEAFYARKIKEDRTLVIRVPFAAKKGDAVTIALGLPNDMVMAIDGAVVVAKPAADGKRSQVMLKLHGMTDSAIGRLKALVEDGRGGNPIGQPAEPAKAQSPLPIPPRPGAAPRPGTVPPPAAPIDAPVDEVVEQPAIPTVEDVQVDEREVFLALEAEHRRLREAAAHEVLGVAWDADVAAIRRGYFGLVKKHHPDVYSRHRSQAVMHLAEEVFIHINKAYDRMRDAAAAAGQAIIAGPSLLPHNGWVAGLEDVDDAPTEEESSTTVRGGGFVAPAAPRAALSMTESGPLSVNFGNADPFAPPEPAPEPEPEPPPREKRASIPPAPFTEDGLFGDVEPPSERMAARPATDTSQVSQLFATRAANGSDMEQVADLEASARTALAADDYAAAVEHLAGALHIDARNRPLRALYHVARGHQLADDGKAVDATTQYETALRHDPDCTEAREALRTRRASKKKGLFGRFRK